MAALKEITVPDIGDASEVEVIEILVAAGDSVAADDSLITLESDKASMEIPAPEAGTVKEIKINIGDKISQGNLILLLEPANAASSNDAKPAAAEAPAPKADEPAAPVAGTQDEPVVVPDIGDAGEVEVIEILISVGDTVAAEDSLITLESDKASMEIPAPNAGTIKEILVKIGDKVSQGSAIATLSASSAPTELAKVATTAAPAPKAAAPATTAATPAVAPPSNTGGQRPAPVPAISESGFSKAHASPSVRKFARELGADLGLISGSGNKGRILKEDVQHYIKQILTSGASTSGSMPGVAELPDIDFNAFGETETEALTKINKLTGKYLHRSWFYIPHVTQFDEADITDLEAFRKELSAEYKDQGIKITMIAFLLKAVAHALQVFPRFNSSLDKTGENLILKKYCHIGVAVDTPDGLIVPVIRDVNQKSVVELAEAVIDIATRARKKKIKPTEMQGACFTISSLGGIGGTAFTPIVNQPEVAILGVSRSSIKPVYENGEFVPRLMLPLSLSYDHRVIDGVAAAKFTSYLSKVLTDIKRLLL